MAKASTESSTSTQPESSAAMLARNNDPMTLALRTAGAVDLVQLVQLNQAASPADATPSSVGTQSTAVFSSREQSSATKPTSAGTSYPIDGYKGKAVATYASSLSATQGSGSEVEAEQDAIRNNALFGVGDWAAEGPVTSAPLKGAARVRRRPRLNKRHKKPVVIIQRESPANVLSSEDEEPVAQQITRRGGRESKYLRQRRSKLEQDDLVLAEEGRAQATAEASPLHKPFSRRRRICLVSAITAILLTFALATFAAHATGKQRLACTEGIIFAGTVLVSWLTVVAMLVARRALQEALLAGLLEFLVGFALVVKIHDFM